ncbi:hypothetical protein J437_LFUL001947 [Ladona fulva]|uniref:Titin n=1 Tax=Ladona fulva TaxID=123851 RepID=A0A8K0JWH7_LADFU|nr:hypothetical protein J437_LFUL001947 [Ladona fulva]
MHKIEKKKSVDEEEEEVISERKQVGKGLKVYKAKKIDQKQLKEEEEEEVEVEVQISGEKRKRVIKKILKAQLPSEDVEVIEEEQIGELKSVQEIPENRLPYRTPIQLAESIPESFTAEILTGSLVKEQATMSLLTCQAFTEQHVDIGEKEGETLLGLIPEAVRASPSMDVIEPFSVDQPDVNTLPGSFEKTFKPITFEASKSVVLSESLQISETMVGDNVVETSITLEKRDQHAEAKITPREGLEITEITEADFEGRLSENKPILAFPGVRIPSAEPVEISEVFVETKPGKYYPELFVATEAATESISAQRRLPVQQETYVPEKEGDYIPGRLPPSQKAGLTVTTSGDSSIVVCEVSPGEREEELAPKEKPETLQATSEMALTEGVTITVTSSHDKEVELKALEHEEKRVEIEFLEQESRVTSVTTFTEKEGILSIGSTPEGKKAITSMICLETSDVSEAIVQDSEGEFIPQQIPAKVSAGSSIRPEESIAVCQVETGDVPGEFSDILRYRTDEAVSTLEMYEAKEISVVQMQEKEAEMVSLEKPASFVVEEGYSPLTGISVVQPELGEKEGEFPVYDMPETHTVKVAPGHTLHAAQVEETLPTGVVGLLQKDTSAATRASSSHEAFCETVIEEAILGESLSDHKPKKTPEGKVAGLTILPEESISVTEIITEDKEGKYTEMQKPGECYAMPDITLKRVAVKSEVSADTATIPMPDETPTKGIAKMEHTLIEGVVVTQSLLGEKEGHLEAHIRPETKKAMVELGEGLEGVSVMQILTHDTEAEYTGFQHPKEESASHVVPGHEVVVQSETISETGIGLLQHVEPIRGQAIPSSVPLMEILVTEMAPGEGEKMLEGQVLPEKKKAEIVLDTEKVLNITEVIAEDRITDFQAKEIPAVKNVTLTNIEGHEVAMKEEVITEHSVAKFDRTSPIKEKAHPEQVGLECAVLSQHSLAEKEGEFLSDIKPEGKVALIGLEEGAHTLMQVTEIVIEDKEGMYIPEDSPAERTARSDLTDQHPVALISEVEADLGIGDIISDKPQKIEAKLDHIPFESLILSETMIREREGEYRPEFRPDGFIADETFDHIDEGISITEILPDDREGFMSSPEVPEEKTAQSGVTGQQVAEKTEVMVQSSVSELPGLKPTLASAIPAQLPFQSIVMAETKAVEKEGVFPEIIKPESKSAEMVFEEGSVISVSEVIADDKESDYIVTEKPEGRYAMPRFLPQEVAQKLEIITASHTKDVKIEDIIKEIANTEQIPFESIMQIQAIVQEREGEYDGRLKLENKIAQLGFEMEKSLNVMEVTIQDKESSYPSPVMPEKGYAQPDVISQEVAQKLEVAPNIGLGDWKKVTPSTAKAELQQLPFEGLVQTETGYAEKERFFEGTFRPLTSTAILEVETTKGITVTEITTEDKEGKYIASEKPQTSVAVTEFLASHELPQKTEIIAEYAVGNVDVSIKEEATAKQEQIPFRSIETSVTTAGEVEGSMKDLIHPESKRVDISLEEGLGGVGIVSEIYLGDREETLPVPDKPSTKVAQPNISGKEVAEKTEVMTETIAQEFTEKPNFEKFHATPQTTTLRALIQSEVGVRESEGIFLDSFTPLSKSAEVVFEERKVISVTEVTAEDREKVYDVSEKPEGRFAVPEVVTHEVAMKTEVIMGETSSSGTQPERVTGAQAIADQLPFESIIQSVTSFAEKEVEFTEKMPEGKKAEFGFEEGKTVSVSEVITQDKEGEHESLVAPEGKYAKTNIYGHLVAEMTEVISNVEVGQFQEKSTDSVQAKLGQLPFESILTTEASVREKEEEFTGKFVPAQKTAEVAVEEGHGIVSASTVTVEDKEGELPQPMKPEKHVALPEIPSREAAEMTEIVIGMGFKELEVETPQKSLAKSDQLPFEGLILTEAIVSEKESEGIQDLKIESKKAGMEFEIGRSITVLQVVTQDKEEAYPELTRPIEGQALPEIVGHRVAEQSLVLSHIAEKEMDEIIPAAKQSAIEARETSSSILVTEETGHEKEMEFTGKFVAATRSAEVSFEEGKKTLLVTEISLDDKEGHLPSLDLPEAKKALSGLVFDGQEVAQTTEVTAEFRASEGITKLAPKTAQAIPEQLTFEGILSTEAVIQEKEGSFTPGLGFDTKMAGLTFEEGRSIVVTEVKAEDKEEQYTVPEVPKGRTALPEVSSREVALMEEIIVAQGLDVLPDKGDLPTATAQQEQTTFESILRTEAIIREKEKEFSGIFKPETRSADVGIEETGRSITITEVVTEDKETDYTVAEGPQSTVAIPKISGREVAIKSEILSEFLLEESTVTKQPEGLYAKPERIPYEGLLQSIITSTEKEQEFREKPTFVKSSAEMTFEEGRSVSVTQITVQDKEESMKNIEVPASHVAHKEIISQEGLQQTEVLTETHIEEVKRESPVKETALSLQTLVEGVIVSEGLANELEGTFAERFVPTGKSAEINFEEQRIVSILQVATQDKEGEYILPQKPTEGVAVPEVSGREIAETTEVDLRVGVEEIVYESPEAVKAKREQIPLVGLVQSEATTGEREGEFETVFHPETKVADFSIEEIKGVTVMQVVPEDREGIYALKDKPEQQLAHPNVVLGGQDIVMHSEVFAGQVTGVLKEDVIPDKSKAELTILEDRSLEVTEVIGEEKETSEITTVMGTEVIASKDVVHREVALKTEVITDQGLAPFDAVTPLTDTAKQAAPIQRHGLQVTEASPGELESILPGLARPDTKKVGVSVEEEKTLLLVTEVHPEDREDEIGPETAPELQVAEYHHATRKTHATSTTTVTHEAQQMVITGPKMGPHMVMSQEEKEDMTGESWVTFEKLQQPEMTQEKVVVTSQRTVDGVAEEIKETTEIIEGGIKKKTVVVRRRRVAKGTGAGKVSDITEGPDEQGGVIIEEVPEEFAEEGMPTSEECFVVEEIPEEILGEKHDEVTDVVETIIPLHVEETPKPLEQVEKVVKKKKKGMKKDEEVVLEVELGKVSTTETEVIEKNKQDEKPEELTEVTDTPVVHKSEDIPKGTEKDIEEKPSVKEIQPESKKSKKVKKKISVVIEEDSVIEKEKLKTLHSTVKEGMDEVIESVEEIICKPQETETGKFSMTPFEEVQVEDISPLEETKGLKSDRPKEERVQRRIEEFEAVEVMESSLEYGVHEKEIDKPFSDIAKRVQTTATREGVVIMEITPSEDLDSKQYTTVKPERQTAEPVQDEQKSIIVEEVILESREQNLVEDRPTQVKGTKGVKELRALQISEVVPTSTVEDKQKEAREKDHADIVESKDLLDQEVAMLKPTILGAAKEISEILKSELSEELEVPEKADARAQPKISIQESITVEETIIEVKEGQLIEKKPEKIKALRSVDEQKAVEISQIFPEELTEENVTLQEPQKEKALLGEEEQLKFKLEEVKKEILQLGRQETETTSVEQIKELPFEEKEVQKTVGVLEELIPLQIEEIMPEDKIDSVPELEKPEKTSTKTEVKKREAIEVSELIIDDNTLATLEQKEEPQNLIVTTEEPQTERAKLDKPRVLQLAQQKKDDIPSEATLDITDDYSKTVEAIEIVEEPGAQLEVKEQPIEEKPVGRKVRKSLVKKTAEEVLTIVDSDTAEERPEDLKPKEDTAVMTDEQVELNKYESLKPTVMSLEKHQEESFPNEVSGQFPTPSSNLQKADEKLISLTPLIVEETVVEETKTEISEHDKPEKMKVKRKVEEIEAVEISEITMDDTYTESPKEYLPLSDKANVIIRQPEVSEARKSQIDVFKLGEERIGEPIKEETQELKSMKKTEEVADTKLEVAEAVTVKEITPIETKEKPMEIKKPDKKKATKKMKEKTAVQISETIPGDKEDNLLLKEILDEKATEQNLTVKQKAAQVIETLSFEATQDILQKEGESDKAQPSLVPQDSVIVEERLAEIRDEPLKYNEIPPKERAKKTKDTQEAVSILEIVPGSTEVEEKISDLPKPELVNLTKHEEETVIAEKIKPTTFGSGKPELVENELLEIRPMILEKAVEEVVVQIEEVISPNILDVVEKEITLITDEKVKEEKPLEVELLKEDDGLLIVKDENEKKEDESKKKKLSVKRKGKKPKLEEEKLEKDTPIQETGEGKIEEIFQETPHDTGFITSTTPDTALATSTSKTPEDASRAEIPTETITDVITDMHETPAMPKEMDKKVDEGKSPDTTIVTTQLPTSITTTTTTIPSEITVMKTKPTPQEKLKEGGEPISITKPVTDLFTGEISEAEEERDMSGLVSKEGEEEVRDEPQPARPDEEEPKKRKPVIKKSVLTEEMVTEGIIEEISKAKPELGKANEEEIPLEKVEITETVVKKAPKKKRPLKEAIDIEEMIPEETTEVLSEETTLPEEGREVEIPEEKVTSVTAEIKEAPKKKKVKKPKEEIKDFEEVKQENVEEIKEEKPTVALVEEKETPVEEVTTTVVEVKEEPKKKKTKVPKIPEVKEEKMPEEKIDEIQEKIPEMEKAIEEEIVEDKVVSTKPEVKEAPKKKKVKKIKKETEEFEEVEEGKVEEAEEVKPVLALAEEKAVPIEEITTSEIKVEKVPAKKMKPKKEAEVEEKVSVEEAVKIEEEKPIPEKADIVEVPGEMVKVSEVKVKEEPKKKKRPKVPKTPEVKEETVTEDKVEEIPEEIPKAEKATEEDIVEQKVISTTPEVKEAPKKKKKVPKKIQEKEEKPKEEVTQIEEKPEEEEVEEGVTTEPEKKKVIRKKKVIKKEEVKVLVPETPEIQEEKKPEETPKKVEKPKPVLQKMVIERKKIDTKKLKVTQVEPEVPLFCQVKLRKSSIQKREIEKVKVQKIRLKGVSRVVEFSAEPTPLNITELNAYPQQGHLNRNAQEALEYEKKHPEKFRPKRKPKPKVEEFDFEIEDYERPKLEKYEKIEWGERQKKTPKEEEKPEEKKIILGKGKIPEEEVPQETVTLRKVPEKPVPEETMEEKIIKKPKPEERKLKDEPDYKEIEAPKLGKYKGHVEGPEDEMPSEEKPEKTDETPSVEEKPKKKRPAKVKPEEIIEEKTIPMGKGKLPVPPEEEDIGIRKPIPGKPSSPEPEQITLKPWKKEATKDEEEKPREAELKFKPSDTEHIPEEIEPKKFTIDDEEKEKKKKKVIKKKRKDMPEEVPKVLEEKAPEELKQEEPKSEEPKPEEPKMLLEKAPVEEKPEEVAVKKPKEKKPKVEEVVEEVTLKKDEPEKPKEEEAPEVITLKKKIKKPLKVDELEELVTVKAEKKVEEEVSEEIVIKKVPEKVPEEEADVITIKRIKPIKPAEEEVEESITLLPKKPDNDVSEEVTFKKKKPVPVTVEEVAAEVTIKKVKEVHFKEEAEIIEEVSIRKEEPKSEEEVPEKVTIKKKKPKKQEEPVVAEEVIVKAKKPEAIPTEEVTLKLDKPKEPAKEEEADEVTIKKIIKMEPKEEVTEEVTLKKKKPKPVEEVSEEVTVKKKKPKKPKEEESSMEITIKKPKKITEKVTEDVAEEVTLKKKKAPKKKPVEEAAEVTIKKVVVEEKPEEVTEEISITRNLPDKPKEEEVIEEVVVKQQPKAPEDISEEIIIKKKKPVKPKVEEVEEEVTVKKLVLEKKPEQEVEEVTLKKAKKPKKPQETEDVSEEITLKRKEPKEKKVEDVAEEITIRKVKKVPKKPVVEEITEEFTLKKEAPKKKEEDVVEEIQTVTFKPKIPKPKQEIEQEFNIKSNTWEEEEVNLSKTLRLKKKKPLTFEEEAGEETIRIMEEYEEEPEPEIIEEEVVEVEFRKKPKKLKKPEYIVQEEEETEAVVKRRDSREIEDVDAEGYFTRRVSHTEGLDSIEETFQIRRPKKPDEETRQYEVEDIEEEFSIDLGRRMSREIPDGSDYGEDSLQLKLKSKRKPVMTSFEEDATLHITQETVVFEDECHNSDWWFVKKHLTEEKGWVPAQFLKDEASYTLYVQKKLNEKIDKLPVLEKPATEEPVFAPRFVEKVQPKHVPDGSTVQFECKVEGNPRPLITWFRQTAIIKPSPDFQMFYDEDNVATLVVREVFPEDAGMFTCVAKNAAGFASSTAELIVEAPLSDHGSDIAGPPSRKSLSRESSLADILEGIPPTFSQKPKAHVVDEKSDVTLECRLVAVPEPTVKWLFEGKEIVEKESKISVSTVSDMHMYTSTLKIHKVKKSQEGTYEIIANNREGEATVSIVLKVRTGAKEPPNILEPLHGTIVEEGGSVVLSTTIVGNPYPRITWLKDGKKITPKEGDTNLKICKDEKSGINTLTIHNAQKTDAGEYSVKAENAAGKATTLASLAVEVRGVGMETLTPGIERELIAVEPRDIAPPTADFVADDTPHPKPEPPLFIERFQEQTVPEKSTVRLEAKVTGYPQPEITWYKNNKRLKPAPNIKDTFDGENICLEITDADAETDTADYKCVASNPVGKASHGARLTVDVTSVAFTKTLKNVEVEEKSTMILECETSRTVFTTWYQNNVEITRVDRKETVDEGRKHRLIVRNVTHGDAGRYSCKVKNKKTECSVTVTDAGPDFVRRLHDFEIKEREMAVLEVVLSAPDAEVTWHKDGEELVEDESRVIFEKEGPVRKLLIRSTSVHDEGEYTCVLGEQECTAEVTVVELPPEIITKMQDVTIAKGERATFEIELTKGDALVRWFKDGKELHFSEHVQLAIDGKRQRLMIYDSVLEDGGLYSCQVGDQESSATLKVEEPMIDFITRLPDVTLVPQNTEAVFTVELSKEDVEVKWLRNGKTIKKSEKYKMISEGSVRKLLIKKCTLEDQAEYTCVAVNVRSSSRLKVEILETDPRIHLDSLQKEYKIKKGEDVTFIVNYSAIPQPRDEWFVNGKIVKKTKRITQSLSETSASLTITKVEDSDSGSYTVKLANNCGEASAELTLKDGQKLKTKTMTYENRVAKYIITKTSESSTATYTCQARNTAGFAETSCQLVVQEPPKVEVEESLMSQKLRVKEQWKVEVKFTGYPKPEVSWTRDGQSIVSTKHCTIYTDETSTTIAIYSLERNDTGVYTIKAINSAGSASIDLSLRVIDDTVRRSKSPSTTDVIATKSHKFLYRWRKVNEEFSIVDTAHRVTGLDARKEYMFRVTAVNEVGPSLPSHNTKYIPLGTPVPIEPPSIQEPLKGIVIGLNQSVTLSCVIGGVPTPEIKCRNEGNEYLLRIFARNEVGLSDPLESDEPHKVLCPAAAPSAPTSLSVTDITSRSATIQWGPPLSTGGAELTGYVIEKRISTSKKWEKVVTLEPSVTSHCVQNLKEKSEYFFRVYAENSIGLSEPAESDPPPSPPTAPLEIRSIGPHTIIIEWGRPESDGGAPLEGYTIAIRDIKKTMWMEVGRKWMPQSWPRRNYAGRERRTHHHLASVLKPQLLGCEKQAWMLISVHMPVPPCYDEMNISSASGIMLGSFSNRGLNASPYLFLVCFNGKSILSTCFFARDCSIKFIHKTYPHQNNLECICGLFKIQFSRICEKMRLRTAICTSYFSYYLLNEYI